MASVAGSFGTPDKARTLHPSTLSASPQSPMMSPGRRGLLASRYEGKFGNSEVPMTPRSAKRAGVTTFSNPVNPFNRVSSKKCEPSQLHDAKNDASRAGARTRNADMHPYTARSRITMGSAARGEGSGAQRVVASTFNTEAKPGRGSGICPLTGQRSPRGSVSDGVAEALGTTTGSVGWSPASTRQSRYSSSFVNYLNDMKRTERSRRGPPAAEVPSLTGPVHDLCPRRGAVRRAASADVGSSRRDTSVNSIGSERSEGRSESCQRRCLREYSVERRRDNVGTPSLLEHIGLGESSQPSTPHGDRQRKTDMRFAEVVGHMNAAGRLQKEEFQAVRTKSTNTQGLLHSEQVLKYEV